MKKLAILTLASAGLALTACDSAPEREVEETAEAIDESYEAQADLVESMEAGGPNEQAAEQEADALREEGERIEDELKESADRDL